MREAKKLTTEASTLRSTARTQEASAQQARAAMGTVKARQRTMRRTGVAAIGVGAGLTGLAAWSAKRRREAGGYA
jgi:hypothetical protein